ncbi:MAG: hypothetical protein R8N23_18775 [Reichenbachiella sp.]|uniref:hypothetical protein n=1 Tax=Reichenbachiella sp. TaxID=2184521 RepID=UPI002966BE07|nr:hypothetical protein [Reichenbachiella sp.]MDW3211922.1 hypothetical protein [Reichenbachiella sp.]
MNRFALFALLLAVAFTSNAQNGKDKSGPNDHLIKKNLLVDGNISSAGGKNLVLQTNQSTRITVLNTNGYIGMDITNPQERLHINGSVRGSSTGGALRVNTEHGWLDLGPQDGQSVHLHTNMSKFVLNRSLQVDGAIGTYGNRNLELQTNGNTHITVLDGKGFVGLGITNPSERLDVAGNAKVSETITGKDLVSETLSTTDGSFQGNVVVGQNLKVDGLVGIGVAEPVEKLEVAGNAKVSDTISATKLEAEGGDFSDQVHIANQLILDGNMGIGVESPSEKLEVAGNVKATEKVTATSIEAVSADFSDRLSVVNDANIGGNLGIGVENPAEKMEIEGNAVISGNITSQSLSAEQIDLTGDFNVAGNSSVAQNSFVGGQLGVGVEAPTEKLEVAGNIKATEKLIGTEVHVAKAEVSDHLSVTNNVNLGGNLGVGVTAPVEKLEVAGNAVISESLTAKNLNTESMSVNGDFNVEGNSNVAQNSIVLGQLGVGVEAPTEKLEVAGNIKASEKVMAQTLESATIHVADNATISNKLTVQGKIGIGTTDEPAEALEVVGTIMAANYVMSDGSPLKSSLWDETGADIGYVGGNVGIGVNDTRGFKMAIAGDMIVEEVTIDLQADWPDYVFEESYDLPSLKETASFIKENKHLPEIPSAADVEKNGVQVGEMNRLLLQKIEELTLYMIQMQVENEQMMKANKGLLERIEALEQDNK